MFAVRTRLNNVLGPVAVDFFRRTAGWDATVNYERLPLAVALQVGAAAEAVLAAQEAERK